MSGAEQSLADFQVVLERHRANEATYKDRLKDINLTRGRIADQLEALQQTYDKKLRGLEQKLEALRGHNDTLLRENTLYRSEIETYQSRLLEKEKLIAALLAQRRELPVVASSEKSKSDKTDSLNANEDDNRAFKKQPPFKEDLEHPPIPEKIKQSLAPERHLNHQDPPKAEKPLEKQKPRQNKKVPRSVLPQEITNHEVVPQQQIEEPKLAPVEEEQVVIYHPPPPPPRPPAKKNKGNPKRPPGMAFVPQPQEDASNFFSSLGKQEVQEAKAPQEQQQVSALPSRFTPDFVLTQAEPQQEEAVKEPHVQHYQEEIHYPEATPQFEEEQQQLVEEQPHYYQEQYHPSKDEEYQEQQEQHYHAEEYYQTEEHYHAEQQEQVNVEPQEEQQPNFLSHFNQRETEAEAENYYDPPARQKKNRPKGKVGGREVAAAEPVEQVASGSDFFAQLSRGEEAHQLQNIEESSIDHIDRDNSLLSNEQPYFVQPAPKRPVKMSKKKKRDQIKMMDPSCFD